MTLAGPRAQPRPILRGVQINQGEWHAVRGGSRPPWEVGPSPDAGREGSGKGQWVKERRRVSWFSTPSAMQLIHVHTSGLSQLHQIPVFLLFVQPVLLGTQSSPVVTTAARGE